MKSKVIISLFETVRLSVLISPRNLYNSLKSIKEMKPPFCFYSSLFYPITLEGRRGTTDEFATIPFHLDLFSAALVELAKSIPVHSLILSSHLFTLLHLLLFTSSSVCLFFFFLSLCPIGLSLLNQKTLRHGQTILAFVS